MARPSLFPPLPVSEARLIAQTIAEKNAGQPMRRLDVFHELNKSPDSGPSRNLVTASSGYGLTNGGYQAEMLSLTDLGRRLVVEGDESAVIDAVLNVDAFKKFFDAYRDKGVPSSVAGRSFLADTGIPTDRTEVCLGLISQNGRASGLIDKVSGVERVLSRDHAIEKRGGGVSRPTTRATTTQREDSADAPRGAGAGVLPSLNINLEIHLPPDAAPEKYEAIFASMRKHLIDAVAAEPS